MARTTRMFEIVQLLRGARQPMTAAAIAGALEVAKRTVYRDIAALQAMRVPVEGAAGVGYVIRPGYDLPPLMFTEEELEAVAVGLALLRRTRDDGLVRAARQVAEKIDAVLPSHVSERLTRQRLLVSGDQSIPDSRVEPRHLRRAIRDEAKLALVYVDGDGRRSERTVWPLSVVYYIDVVVLAAWCELRQDFRHFRIDRIADCTSAGERFKGQGDGLRARWRAPLSLP